MSVLEYIGIALLLLTMVVFSILAPKVSTGVRYYLVGWAAQIFAAPTQMLSSYHPFAAFFAQGLTNLFPGLLLAGSYCFVGRKPPVWVFIATTVLILARGLFSANGAIELGRQVTLPFELVLYAASIWVITKYQTPPSSSSTYLSLGFVLLMGVEVWDAMTNDPTRAQAFNALPWVIVLVTCAGIHVYSWLVKTKQEAEARERSIEDRFKALTNYARDVFTELSNDGVFLFVSSNAEPVLGYPPSTIMQMSLYEYLELTHAEYLGSTLDLPNNPPLDNMLDNEPFNYRLRIRHADDSHRLIEIGGSMFVDADNQTRIVSVIRDITERVEAEQHNFSRQKLESLGTMSAGIAHDFRNLLTTISGSTELLELDIQHGDFNQVDRHIKQILKASAQASGLTSQLLTYAGKTPLDFEDINLQVTLHSLSPLLHSAIADRAVLQLNIAPDLPTISANPVAIQQIVINLVTNAVEAMEKNNGTVSIQALSEAHINHTQVIKIIVTDDGIGMNKETQALIFEPFYTTKFAGRGLGLAALQGLVIAHSGSIDVTSRPGEGTTFTITLPVPPSQGQEGTRSKAAS